MVSANLTLLTRYAVYLLAALLAACAAPSPPTAPSGTTQPAAPPSPPESAPAAAPPAPVLPPVGSPAARQQAQAQFRRAAELLNDGQEDKAREELALGLQLEPDSKFGQCLNKGITADPQATLGSTSHPYTVRPGETLGRIAQRALGDACEFYLLARYNQFPVPRQLQAGQVLKIPGRTPLAAPDGSSSAETRPPPADHPVSGESAASQARNAEARAAEARAAEARAAEARAAEARAGEARLKARIEGHHRNAQSAFRRQDLATAIREWTNVLELDPSNDLARARRQEAIDLEARLKRLK